MQQQWARAKYKGTIGNGEEGMFVEGSQEMQIRRLKKRGKRGKMDRKHRTDRNM